MSQSVLDEIKRSTTANQEITERWTPPPSALKKFMTTIQEKISEVAVMEHSTLIVVISITLTVLGIAILWSYRHKRRVASTSDEKTAESAHL